MAAERQLRLRAFAKINLMLQVIGARTDGFHELRTIFQSIALHDTLALRVERGPFRLEANDPECPRDESNLVWRAAEQLWAVSGRRGSPRDVCVRITKRIPMQAGLGGGISDGAAALRGFARLWRIDAAAVRDVGALLGADVPYFLEGGTVLGLDRGDVLVPLADLPPFWVVLAIPPLGVSTRDAYAWWDEDSRLRPRRSVLDTREHYGASASAPGARVGPRRNRKSGATHEARNDLQEPVAARHPEIARLVSAFDRAGVTHAAMSGSGSAVFGLFGKRADAERMVRTLERADNRALITRTLNRASYQRLAGIRAHRIHFPFAPRGSGCI